MADSLRRDYPLDLVLGRLGLARSTYYRYAGGKNPRADRYADVRPLVREAFSRTANGMGYRQVALVLRNEREALKPQMALRLEEGQVFFANFV